MTAANEAPAPRRGLVLALPLLIFAGMAAFLGWRLYLGRDPSLVPSALIGREAPAFNLPAVPGAGKPGLSDADLRKGGVTVVNIFASWCAPCRLEHPILRELAENQALKAMGVRLVGVNYKDDPANVTKFLSEEGDPYAAIGMDASGRVGIDWGLTGVPETFIVRGDGKIAYKFIGPITQDTLDSTVLPQIAKALR
ncbi:DsbE family thiol:disulfide interchange protein [Rhodoblastus acidophilus]|uniref:DsbE family thiol:disulfide interchange protein n=1 Tax=Candidatus Rhodoblastus alkanivorans TaxID=2954117 RepID=A0ABS9Z2P9_9HYPH|nr:DsbE family thiol:disulfide interchange protein [Candidatus Rhodoblastus alkanivorans]MCI4678069.1 DsbE family thiol:disulfide interchange protein [Candidatus Rhodoblastus alkanivorans]MCI4681590.1 DsbE family thiol:disulfide interchange protein [Candidatus Rhodoblastus alkanivorans]MDI4642638.1 DsbE family thiol:disulfide interchange protein [Rhodoblastus acidophilus]